MSKPSLQPALHRAQIQLNELPAGSVILDRFGDAWQAGRLYMALVDSASGYWYRAYGDSSEVSSWELAQRGPIKTIWRPDE